MTIWIKSETLATLQLHVEGMLGGLVLPFFQTTVMCPGVPARKSEVDPPKPVPPSGGG